MANKSASQHRENTRQPGEIVAALRRDLRAATRAARRETSDAALEIARLTRANETLVETLRETDRVLRRLGEAAVRLRENNARLTEQLKASQESC